MFSAVYRRWSFSDQLHGGSMRKPICNTSVRIYRNNTEQEMQFKPASISISNNQLFSASMFVMIWKCTGARQIIACVLAVGVALLHIAPIEIQRQAVDYAIPAPDLNLLLILSLAYLGLVLAYQLSKFVLNTYQIWIGESINQFLRHRIIGTERQNHLFLGEVTH